MCPIWAILIFGTKLALNKILIKLKINLQFMQFYVKFKSQYGHFSLILSFHFLSMNKQQAKPNSIELIEYSILKIHNCYPLIQHETGFKKGLIL